MHGHGGETSKPGKFLTVASVVLAFAAVGISFYGWLAAHNSFSDALFHALKSIEMDEVYNHLYSEEHEKAALSPSCRSNCVPFSILQHHGCELRCKVWADRSKARILLR